MKKSILKLSLCAALALTAGSAFATVTSLGNTGAKKLFGSVNPLHPMRMTTTLTLPKTLGEVTLKQANGINASLNGTTLTLDYYLGQPVTLVIYGVQHGGGAKNGGARECHYIITTTGTSEKHSTVVHGYADEVQTRIVTKTMCGPVYVNSESPQLKVKYLD